LSASIANASWGTLISQLKYKCAWYGKKLIIIDPKNTIGIVHECKQKNNEFNSFSQSEGLAAREWTCPICHPHLERDVNGAKNILAKE
uniref:transposase n=1 Tax=Segatella hominis TaxID=2518605 RepID=UPI0021C5FD23